MIIGNEIYDNGIDDEDIEANVVDDIEEIRQTINLVNLANDAEMNLE